MGYRSFMDVPAWQAARAYKLAIYGLCDSGVLADAELRTQLRRAAARPPAHIAEAYGRFNPADSARLLTMAKAELLETQNHLIDAHDQRFIADTARTTLHDMAQAVVEQIDGWREYLQSQEAQKNVRAIREHRRRERARRRNENRNPNPNPNPNEKEESESDSEC